MKTETQNLNFSILDSSNLEAIVGGNLCVTNTKVNGVITGVCITAGWLNIFVGAGCGIYTLVQYASC